MATSIASPLCTPASGLKVRNSNNYSWQSSDVQGVQLRASSLRGYLGLHHICRRSRVIVTIARGQVAVKAETKYLEAEDAAKAVKEEGYTVVDIRDQAQYDKAHIEGSVHIPLFIENKDSDPATLIKRQMHQNFVGVLYGLAFTKINEQFLPTFGQKFSKDSKILVVCQEGLRAGNAIDQLEEAGYQNLAQLVAGLNKVPPGTFPKEGKRELKDAGRGGFVAIQTQFSVVLGTVLFGAYLYVEFFPEQASQLLKNISPPGS